MAGPKQEPASAERIIRQLSTMTDDDLTWLIQMAVLERKERRRRTAHKRIRQFRPKDRVRVTPGIRPNYMVGATGEVQRVLNTKVEVLFDEQRGRFGRLIRVPATSLTKIEGDSEGGSVKEEARG